MHPWLGLTASLRSWWPAGCCGRDLWPHQQRPHRPRRHIQHPGALLLYTPPLQCGAPKPQLLPAELTRAFRQCRFSCSAPPLRTARHSMPRPRALARPAMRVRPACFGVLPLHRPASAARRHGAEEMDCLPRNPSCPVQATPGAPHATPASPAPTASLPLAQRVAPTGPQTSVLATCPAPSVVQLPCATVRLRERTSALPGLCAWRPLATTASWRAPPAAPTSTGRQPARTSARAP